MERTFIIIKLDAIEKNLVEEIIKRLENKNLRIVKKKLLNLSKEQVNKFTSIFPKSVRPLQKLNGRKIRQGL